jgi:hypothetical protein
VTNDDIIARGLAIRDEISAIKKRHTAELLEYEQALEAIENYLLKVMQERGEKQIKTNAGTAFQSHQIRVSMADREALQKYTVLTGDWGFWTNHVAKEHVKEYRDAKGVNPPGVEVTTFVQCNIRKA